VVYLDEVEIVFRGLVEYEDEIYIALLEERG